MSDTGSGWSVSVYDAAGKTEVLAADPLALARLRAVAETIPMSEIYPSFREPWTHALYFFDTRPEFVAWLKAYTRQFPAPERSAVQEAARPARRFSFREVAAAAALLVAIVGGVAASGIYSPSDSAPPAPQVFAAEETPDTSPPEPIITIVEIPDTSTSPDTPALDSPAASPVRFVSGALTAYFVDVGQGDGIILKLPSGRFAVVDACKNAGRKMKEILERLGCREIEAMVMTHPHLDHNGDLDVLLRSFKVKKFYDPGYPHTTATYRGLLLAVERYGPDYIIPKPGDRLVWDPQVSVEVLSAGGTALKDLNDASIVLRIGFGSTAMILTGDAEAEAERGMLERFRTRLSAQLLKVGHHGSRSSTTPEFLAAIRPKYGVISCGVGNTYGHPHPLTLSALERAGVKVYRTDLHGTVMAVLDGRTIRVTTERGSS